MSVRYILKLWVSVILFTPILPFIYGYFFTPHYVVKPKIEFLFLIIVFGFAFSTPTLFVLMICSYLVEDWIKNLLILKLCYIIATLVGMLATVVLIWGWKTNGGAIYACF